MNKKNLSIAIIFLVGILAFNGCKKSENDPFISLRSRDARITGTWNLTGFTQTQTQYQPFNQTTLTSTQTFNGSTMVVTSGTNSDSYTFSQEMTIEKDGTYSMIVISDGDRTEEAGYWFWLNGAKDKTYIAIGGDSYRIDQLKNSELILIENSSSKETNSDGDIVSNTTVSTTITFTKK